MPNIKVIDEPCNCDPKYIYDHTEFGLPIGCDTYCSKCHSMWTSQILPIEM